MTSISWAVVGIILVLMVSVTGFLISWLMAKKLHNEKWSKLAVIISIFINVLFFVIMTGVYGYEIAVFSTLCMSIFFSVIFLEYYKKFNRITPTVIISMWACMMILRNAQM